MSCSVDITAVPKPGKGKGGSDNSLPRIGESLATERQAIGLALRPPASWWDLSVPTISCDKGSGISPTASASGHMEDC